MSERRRRRLVDAGILALLMLAAMGIRWLPYEACFRADRIYFFGADTYDHMRRVFLAIEHFPAVPAVDYYQGFPVGTANVWPPLFHLSLASVSLIVGGGAPEPRTVETIGAASPTVAGALCLLPVYFLARGIAGRRAAWVAAAATALLPAQVLATTVGRPDNNALEPILAASLFCTVAWLLPRSKEPADAGEESASVLIGRGVPVAVAGWLALFSWRGSSLFVLMILAYAWFEALISPWGRRHARSVCLPVGAASFLLALGIVPFVLLQTWGARSLFAFGVISWLHVMLFAVMGAALMAVAHLPRSWTESAAARIVATGLGLSVLVLLPLWAFAPGLLGQPGIALHTLLLRGGARWGIAEWTGLLQGASGVWDWGRPIDSLGWAGLAAPWIWIGMAIGEIRGGLKRPRRTWFLIWSLVFGIIAIFRVRFAALAALGVALLLGVLVETLFRWLQARWPRIPAAASLGSLILAAVLLLPSVVLVRELSQRSFRYPVTDALFTGLDWMRENTPPTGHYLDPAKRPEYGVLAQWDFGSWISYVARRPAVATPWGDETYGLVPQARFFLTEEIDDAERLLEENEVRYVIVTNVLRYLDDFAGMLGRSADDYLEEVHGRDGEIVDRPRPGWGRLVGTRLLLNDGLSLTAPPHEDAPPGHLRLVHESSGRLDIRGFPKPVSRVKIFEYVRGAVLRGPAAPGSIVRVDVALRTNQGRTFTWTSVARAAENGNFLLEVPYATDGTATAVAAVGPYDVLVGGTRVRVSVAEDAVQNGRTIRVDPVE